MAFDQVGVLKKHIIVNHFDRNINMGGTGMESPLKKGRTCNGCTLAFDQVGVLKKHIIVHHFDRNANMGGTGMESALIKERTCNL